MFNSVFTAKHFIDEETERISICEEHTDGVHGFKTVILQTFRKEESLL